MDTLRGAIDYINGLQDLLDENESVASAFQDVLIPQNVSSSSSSSSLVSSDDKENTGLDSLSDGSQSPGYTSEIISSDGDDSHLSLKTEIKEEIVNNFSPDEEDLLDFNSWFQ